jgi:phosphoenolpyruvate synthase/pyruvate phosphate dikinase
MVRFILCYLFCVSVASGCITPTPLPTSSDSSFELSSQRLYTSTLKTRADFDAYSKVVAGERFTKFIVDLRTDRIYYFDVNIYKLHVDFVFNEIYRQPISNRRLLKFNRNYDAKKPEFLLGYLVHHQGPDLWTLAFWEGDRATEDHVRRALYKIGETFYLGKKVQFRPDSTAQEAVARSMADIPWISNDKIYKATDYHAFNKGFSVGRLRVIAGQLEKSPVFDSQDIVVLEESLPDITPVRGIITEQFSTPLSHLALRARAWKVPHVGLKGATKTYAGLDGKTVYFEAKGGTHLLRLATAAEVQAQAVLDSRKRHIVLPPADTDEADIVRLLKLDQSRANAYGAKSANLGEMVRGGLDGFKVPAGVAVPIRYYDEHLKRHGLWEAIKTAITEPKFKKDAVYRASVLAELRQKIVDSPLDPEFEGRVANAIAPLASRGVRGLFVRSSTNAEDLAGFNGAGLYDTVPNVKGAQEVSMAIRKVWASVWNLRAYEERQHFGIDHLGVYGAVLIQIGIDATAAGVLVTTNIFDQEDKDTYTINAKSGLGMRVVEGKRVPEQLLFDTTNMGIKVLSRSAELTMLVFDENGGVKEVANPDKGLPILSDSRVMQLGMAAKEVKELFGWKEAVDIEWLFQGHELFLVQARPYVDN